MKWELSDFILLVIYLYMYTYIAGPRDAIRHLEAVDSCTCAKIITAGAAADIFYCQLFQ